MTKHTQFLKHLCAVLVANMTLSSAAIVSAQQTPSAPAATRPQAQATAAKNQDPRELQRAMIKQEEAHRSRLARMRRLEQVYRERGDRQKLTQLEEIQGKERTRYGRWQQAQQVKLGRDRYDKVNTELARGRERGQTRNRVAAQRQREHAATHANDATREQNIDRKKAHEREANHKAAQSAKERPKPSRPAGGGQSGRPPHK